MKKNRQAMIARIIETNSVGTQEDLLALLLAAGVNVTQATVSRDIKEMRIVKHPGPDGEYKYCLPGEKQDESNSKYMTLLKGSVSSTDIAMNTVVVKCHAGTAQAACAALDSINLKNVAGTIAGDDTIFILCYTPSDAVSVKDKIDSLFNF